MKRLFPLLLVLPLLAGCRQGNQPTRQQLVQIDSLLNKELADSAWREVQRVDTAAMTDEERAYYQLLRVQAMWKAYVPVASDSLLDFSLAFYKANGPRDLLARTYYYKGAVQSEKGKTREAVENLKQAELLAADVGDLLLRSKICNRLEDINFTAGDYPTALRYAKEAVACCEGLNNPKLLVEDYEVLAVAYHHVGKTDSALYYFEQCIPLIASVSKDEQAHVLANLGVYYKNLGSVQKAEELLRRSLDIEPHGFAYRSLAGLYADRGDMKQAEEMYVKALEVARRSDTRISTLQAFRELKMQQGDYRRANDLANEIAQLKDSVDQKRREDNVERQQQLFDERVEHEQLESGRRTAWLWSGGLLAVLAVGAVLAYQRKRHSENRLQALQRQMAENAQAIEKVKEEAARTQQLMDSMASDNRKSRGQLQYANERLTQLEQAQEDTLERMKKNYVQQLSHGCVLFEQFMAGGNTKNWYKRDYQDFETYYCMRDIPFSVVLQDGYSQLSPQQRFTLIMSHLGKSDEEIRTIMGMSEGAWRTMLSRMKKMTNTDGDF